jgi:hypothetical protein
MIWGYLSEFWDSISDVVVGGVTYSIDWFKGIGNAVAGAVGSLFDDLIHHFYDIFYAFHYLLENLGIFFTTIFKPIVYFFYLLKGFFTASFIKPEETDIAWSFGSEIMDVFLAIPYWSVFMFALGGGVSILIIIFIFKRLSAI